ncbi:MAG: hypothetical protein ABW217_10765 [Polyangiaceae bacterium]
MTDEPTPEAKPEPRDEPAPRPRLNARGEERPRFLLELPHDPALEPVIEAFESGNYARVRVLAPELAKNTADPEVRRAAEELRARIEPDPLVLLLLAVAIGLFLFVVIWVYVKQAP